MLPCEVRHFPGKLANTVHRTHHTVPLSEHLIVEADSEVILTWGGGGGGGKGMREGKGEKGGKRRGKRGRKAEGGGRGEVEVV